MWLETRGPLAVLMPWSQRVHIALDKRVIQLAGIHLLPHLIRTGICDTKILFSLLSHKCCPDKHIQLTMKSQSIHSLVAEHISFCHPHAPSFQGNFDKALNAPRVAINYCGIPILDDKSLVPL